jgi:hypothetical protein
MGMLINPYAFTIGGGVSTLFSDTLPLNTSGFADYNIRNVLGASNLSGSGTQIRVEFQSGTVSGYDLPLSGAYVGEKASSGNSWDFDGNQVQLLFGGSSSKTILSGEKFFSDWVSFSVDDTKDLIVSFAITASTNNSTAYSSTLGNSMYYKSSSGSDVGTTAPSSYSTVGTANYCVSKIEVK